MMIFVMIFVMIYDPVVDFPWLNGDSRLARKVDKRIIARLVRFSREKSRLMMALSNVCFLHLATTKFHFWQENPI